MVMIGIWLALAGLMVVGIFVAVKTYNFELEMAGVTVALVSGIVLFVALVCWPLNYYGWQADIEAYNSINETIESSRQDEMSAIERAALTTTIAGINAKIAKGKYWKQTIFSVYIPDEVMDLEPIK